MRNKLPPFQKARNLTLGAAAMALSWSPALVHAQSAGQQAQPNMATQDRPGDDGMRRDVAQFDQFLDNHHDIADQLRRTPSLIDDPQFLQSHPELNTYLQDHPSVKTEISQRPDSFMRLEDVCDHDHAARDRDAGGQDRDAGREMSNRDADRRGATDFNRFLDDHREIGEQVRKDPSLVDNRDFLRNHPDLQSYLQQNPGVRDQLRQDPNFFMHQENSYDRDANPVARDAGQDRDAARADTMNQDRDVDRRDAGRRDVANFDRFLDGHREIAEQVRKDPSLLDNRDFVRDHAALQAYLQQNPGVRDQLRQDPNTFMHQEDAFGRDANMRDRDPMHDHMADFGGFLRSHSDIAKDVSKDPSCIKDHDYLQKHGELDAYLNAHPDVRADWMANPQGFVHGAQQYSNPGAAAATGAAGVSSHVTGSAGADTPRTAGVNSHPTATPGATGGSTPGAVTTAPPTGASTNPAPKQNH